MKKDNIDRVWKHADSLLPLEAKKDGEISNKKGLWTIPILISAFVGSLIGPITNPQETKQRWEDFKKAKFESGDVMDIQFILTERNPEAYKTIDVPYLGGDFDIISAKDPELQTKQAQEIAQKIIQESFESIDIYMPYPFSSGFHSEDKSSKVKILGIIGGSSSENYGKKTLNDSSDQENLDLAQRRAESVKGDIMQQVQTELDKQGIKMNIEDIYIDKQVNLFTQEELQLLGDIAINHNIQGKDDNEKILNLLYVFHNSQIYLNDEEKTNISSILDKKRQVQISLEINDGQSIKVFNFSIFLSGGIAAIFFFLTLMFRMRKSGNLRYEIVQGIERGMSDDEIQEKIIDKNKHYGKNNS